VEPQSASKLFVKMSSGIECIEMAELLFLMFGMKVYKKF